MFRSSFKLLNFGFIVILLFCSVVAAATTVVTVVIVLIVIVIIGGGNTVIIIVALGKVSLCSPMPQSLKHWNHRYMPPY